MSANDHGEIDQAWITRSKRVLDGENKKAIARYRTTEDFTVVEAALLLTGRDPVFWGAPSARILLDRKPDRKLFGKATALFKELLKQLEEKRLRATSLAFNGDGTYDGEKTRISRADLDAFRKTCHIDTVPLPSTPESRQRSDTVAPAVVSANVEPVDGKDTAKHTIAKRSVMLARLRVRYPKLENAIRANAPEFKDCRVPNERAPTDKGGFYYLEKVEAVCAVKWQDCGNALFASPAVRKLKQ